MKIWKLKVPVATPYAELNCLYIKHSVPRCGACGAATAAPTLPIDVEWDDGSDLLGDFVHAGAKIVTRRTIGETLQTRFGGITLGEVAMPDHPNLRRPKRVTKRTPRRIWLPYEGPELCYLDPVDVDLDPSSTIEIDKQCQECGTIRYRKLNGVEVKTLAAHTPREPERGLFVTSSAISGIGLFRPRYTGLTLCIDAVRDFIVQNGWNNIEFLEYGDVLSA